MPPQVLSNRMHKSILVGVDRIVKIPKYNKEIRRTTKLMVRRKCWEVTDILHRAKVYDAESATRGAVEKLREASDRGFAASAV
ncbi:hypothetical protein QBZ16_005073 [Prototheca wickerhamii]|uniref:Uncharacterized protein n=1 Tax=Prototheca wickerhamii TaxID=3111 RepID=A0AAD9MMF5_PROWI|nr:hypothetical protein QBZ16_005073 [Prototheca wickerhamii]